MTATSPETTITLSISFDEAREGTNRGALRVSVDTVSTLSDVKARITPSLYGAVETLSQSLAAQFRAETAALLKQERAAWKLEHEAAQEHKAEYEAHLGLVDTKPRGWSKSEEAAAELIRILPVTNRHSGRHQ